MFQSQKNNSMDRKFIAAAAATVCFSLASAFAGDWTQFRGPNGDGLTNEKQLPTTWSPEKNIQWKIKVPGVAWSCPIILGDKVFVTTAVSEDQPKPSTGGGPGGGGGGGFGGNKRVDKGDKKGDFKKGDAQNKGGKRRGGEGGGGGGGGFGGGRGQAAPNAVYRWEIHCLDRNTGKTLWSKVACEKKPSIPTHRTNTYASETPITDGERIYAYFGMTGLFCYDINGTLLWQKDVGSFPMMAGWGTGSSPVLVGNRLFLACDNEENSFLVAFDKKTGDELWRVKRNERSNWATPYLWKNKDRSELVVSGSTKIRSYDPENGKVLWELGGLNGRSAGTPVSTDSMLFVGTGGGQGGPGPLFAVKAGATGDITLADGETSNKFIAWMSPKGGPQLSSPILYQDYLYILDQRGGVLSCYDSKTGEQSYRQRLPGAKGFTSSPWAYDGKVFCLDDEGQTFVIEAGPKLKVEHVNKLNEMFWSTVSISNGALFLRGLDHLYCIRQGS